MIEKLLRHILRFVTLVLLQVLVLNNIQLGGYINPNLYVLFILLLPVEVPGWLLMAVSFFLGLSIDAFTNTPGMNASACVFLAFCRPYLLKIMSPRDGYETDRPPSIQYMGFSWFIIYASILVFLHHLVLFYVEIFRFTEFFSTFLRVILSTVITVSLILLAEFLLFKTKSQK